MTYFTYIYVIGDVKGTLCGYEICAAHSFYIVSRSEILSIVRRIMS